MCIIMLKNKGVNLPSEKTLKTMWKNNPDGAGMMFQRAGSKYIFIKKGFMTYDDFINNYRNENFGIDDTVVLHFRITTSGGTNKKMTHPFIVSNNRKKITSLTRVTKRTVIAHNGVIHNLNGIEKNYSDTAIFARDYLSNEIIYNNVFTDPILQDMIEKYIDGSRMVFLNPNHEPLILGEWYEEDGLLYSNDSFMFEKVKPNFINKWGNNYDFEFEDDYYDDISVNDYTYCDYCTSYKKNVTFNYQYQAFVCKDCIKQVLS